MSKKPVEQNLPAPPKGRVIVSLGKNQDVEIQYLLESQIRARKHIHVWVD
jgi:hypothetical protein